ncbi:NRDE family protein [Bacillus solimangrovi]|uniref:NRDE family protein n=1 Tax=Bacillus solimangrovi TaxID=1305675 RepID=A0A1E5LF65_9BACI|nr:NRDE family protein [Bacillus solimangrovi]OEH92728.1 hypothetical protein BFG57_01615 [Bacillus solimangrovi]
MCLILFAYQKHPQYPLIVAANRDEFYERRTRQAQYWLDAPNVLAGRDLEKLGTWMGVTKEGKFAALTNYRNPSEESKSRSRGEIVADFLTEHKLIDEYVSKLEKSRGQYPGYNVLFGTAERMMYYSNVENTSKELPSGIYGLSNHLLDTPWPKVRRGKEQLRQALQNGNLQENLFKILHDQLIAKDEDLPNTGVGLEWERLLSPLFIQSEHYGTRASTVLLVDVNGNVHFTERTFSSRGFEEENKYTIRLN